jgi:hypothetical protein
MSDIHQRLDNIRAVLEGFRHEQERVILNSSDENRYRENSLPSRGTTNGPSSR